MVAEDGSLAELLVPAGCGLGDRAAETLTALAQGAGVQVDSQVDAVITAITSSFKLSAAEQRFVLSRWTQPVQGHDGCIRWEAAFDPNPQAPTAQAKTNHYSGARYVRASVGDQLGVWQEPTHGTDGRDVRGRVLKARRGLEVPFTLHPSVSRDSLGRLSAQMDGVLKVRDGKVSVDEALRVSGNVDFATGNIDFSGAVEVAGGVASGFAITSTRDLTIGGLIECATIRCGGEFHAKGGIVGHGKGTLVVQGNARLVYAEKLSGEIAGSLQVERELVDCRLRVGKEFHCPGGTVLGGQLTVEGSMVVGSLGSIADVPTTLVLGEVPILDDGQASARAAIEAMQSDLAKVTERERILRLKPKPTAADREQLTECSYEISQLTADLAKRSAELLELEKARKAKQRVDVHVAGNIHARVRFVIGGATVDFKQKANGPIWVGWDSERRLVYRHGSGETRPLSQIARVTTERTTPATTGKAA